MSAIERDWGDDPTTQQARVILSEWLVRHYVWLPDWGAEAPDDPAQLDAACERAEAWLTEHEGDAISIRVRMPQTGEAEGTYEVRESGDLQILGHSIEEPEDVRELLSQAWEHAWETWADEADR